MTCHLCTAHCNTQPLLFPLPTVFMELHTKKAIHESLHSLPPEIKRKLPEKYERIGDILVIHLDALLIPYKRDIGKAYKEAFKVKTVLLKGKIRGEYRIPDYEIIAGSETTTIHKENKILYKVDLSKVMFSAGNISERIRMSSLSRKEEVVDMFAGIGYFTLPIAKFCRSYVDAVEKNEDAYQILRENIVLNKVQELVTPHLMDCKDFRGRADRVIMGHPEAHKYLGKAFEIVDRGFVHYHEFVPEKNIERVEKRLNSEAEKAGKDILIGTLRKIKKYSPGVWHIVCDVEVLP